MSQIETSGDVAELFGHGTARLDWVTGILPLNAATRKSLGAPSPLDWGEIPFPQNHLSVEKKNQPFQTLFAPTGVACGVTAITWTELCSFQLRGKGLPHL